METSSSQNTNKIYICKKKLCKGMYHGSNKRYFFWVQVAFYYKTRSGFAPAKFCSES